MIVRNTLIIFVLILMRVGLFSQSVGGVLNQPTVVCAGNNSGILSVSGYTGTIMRWEYSYGIGGPWTPIVFTANSYNYLNLLQSTYFRVVVQQTGYSEALSNAVLISCDLPSISGSVQANSLQCLNSSATATLSGNTGTLITWEYSLNNWVTTFSLSPLGTTTTTIPNLTSTTHLRAKVSNGVCPFAYTNSITIIPASNSVGGTIVGLQTVCAGNNGSILTLTGNVGFVQQWESSTSSGGPFTIISNSQNTNTVSYTNLNQDHWYRAVVKNGTCPSSNSSIFGVHVDSPSIGGNIVGPPGVCMGVNTGTLQLIGNNGSVNVWEYSSNGGTTWSTISTTSNIHVFQNIPNSRLYRAQIQNGICSPAFSAQFSVNAYAVPSPTFNLSNRCALTNVSFTNYTTGSNSYLWDFGDGAGSGIYHPSHTYLSPGTYSVKLTATSTLGCTDSIKKSITIHPLPQAGFLGPDTTCFGTQVAFTNSSQISSGTVSSTEFNFGDGSPTNTLPALNHQFLNSGIYHVSLKAISGFGCRDSFSKPVIVHPKPLAAFQCSNVCVGNSIAFTNLSTLTGGSMQYTWNFGNGSLSLLPHPNYIYPSAGVYFVSLIVTTNHNCRDTSIRQVAVNERPSIVLSATNACLENLVLFDTQFSSQTPSMAITLEFGDGTFSLGHQTGHNYSLPGIFSASVSGITDSGCVSTSVKNVQVYPKPLAIFFADNVCNKDSVLFNNSSTISNGSNHFVWNMASLNSSTLTSPKYVFPSPGVYQITLVAISDKDCSDTATKMIKVFDAPVSDFKFNNPCDGFPVTFTNTSSVYSGVITSSNWNFGDNTTSNVTHPQKNFLNHGSYKVSLISISSNGCKDTAIKELNVFEAPVANFSYNDVCIGNPVTFTNTSNYSKGNYSSRWSFGVDHFSEEFSPKFIYEDPGNYPVQLKITTVQGCLDSLTRFVSVFNLPKVSAGADTTIELGNNVVLSAQGAVSYNWYPAEGLNNPVSENPKASPEQTTDYIVVGTDVNGCSNSDTVLVKVDVGYIVIPYNVLTPDGNGKNDTWIVKNIEAYKNNKVIIFDQWNQEVYTKESYSNEWDGRNMRGEILPDATYYYILTFTDSKVKYSGYITLMRNGLKGG